MIRIDKCGRTAPGERLWADCAGCACEGRSPPPVLLRSFGTFITFNQIFIDIRRDALVIIASMYRGTD